MKLPALLILPAVMLSSAAAAPQENRLFEMRTYYAAPGKLDDLMARFRNHTTRLFEKHGMVNIGYWLPLTNTENKIVYLLAFPNREAREKSFKEFGADPDWQKTAKESEKNGRLVAKAESVFLEPTDFSPAVKPGRAAEPRVYELRTYKAAPGKLPELLARFRNHTTTLFAKHGMSQLGYWAPAEKKDGAEDTLIYVLAHKSVEACEASFKAFRSDPAWVKAKADSELNGPLTAPGGVQSLLMRPADFSPAQ